ncbi:MAG: ComEC/Rec2 family competence protein [Synechococcus sp.]
MIQTYWIALAWLLGLILHSVPWGCLLPPVFAAGMALQNRYNIRLVRTVLVAGCIGILAWGYANVRSSIAPARDISIHAPQANVTVVAKVESLPRRTGTNRHHIWVSSQAYGAEGASLTETSGKLYVTYDLGSNDSNIAPPMGDRIPEFFPGQVIELHGYLYEPSGADNPGGLDFRDYLARKGAFAGLSATDIEMLDPAIRWGGWTLRHRIVSAFRHGLGDRRGQLLGSMVLGSSASQLPRDLAADFRTVGLAHVTAASGFHVALLLGIVLWGTARLGNRQRQWIAISILTVYLVLTGGSPSAMRATLMGSAVVFGRSIRMQGRTIQPLGLLLATAVALTILQPLWIDNAGFLLSFAATFGLMVSTAPLQKRLDFVPSNLAAAIATPLAALLWTLPLQLALFGKLSPYFLIASLITAPLVTLSIGAGLVVAAISLLLPPFGGVLAWPLRFILDPLIGFVSWIATWPGATVYTGTASILQCLTLYGMLMALTFSDRFIPIYRVPTVRLPDWQRLSLGVTGAVLVLVIIPALWPQPTLQIVTLATSNAPTIVIRSGGQTALINSGSTATVELTVLPYLRSEGIRSIDRAIALAPGRSNGGWETLAGSIPIGELWTSDRFAIGDATGMQLSSVQETGTEMRQLKSGDGITIGTTRLQPVAETALSFTIAEGTGLILGSPLPNLQQLRDRHPELSTVKWLWWDGTELPPEVTRWLQPEVAIAGGDRRQLDSHAVPLQVTDELIRTEAAGATTWTPRNLSTMYGNPL